MLWLLLLLIAVLCVILTMQVYKMFIYTDADWAYDARMAEARELARLSALAGPFGMGSLLYPRPRISGGADTDTTSHANDVPKYYVEESDIDSHFVERVRDIVAKNKHKLKTPAGHTIQEASDKESANIHIYLKSRDEMNKLNTNKEYYSSGKVIWFSWTYQHPNPTIFIDGGNWLNGVDASGLSLDEYREYVINHELMHALGYDHQKCNSSTASEDGVCPVMFQSTRGCPKGFKCGYIPTDVDYTSPIKGAYFVS